MPAGAFIDNVTMLGSAPSNLLIAIGIAVWGLVSPQKNRFFIYGLFLLFIARAVALLPTFYPAAQLGINPAFNLLLRDVFCKVAVDGAGHVGVVLLLEEYVLLPLRNRDVTPNRVESSSWLKAEAHRQILILAAAIKMVFNQRWIGTDKIAPHVPVVVDRHADQRQFSIHRESRIRFLIRRLCLSFLLFYLDQYLKRYLKLTCLYIRYSDFSVYKASFIRRLPWHLAISKPSPLIFTLNKVTSLIGLGSISTTSTHFVNSREVLIRCYEAFEAFWSPYAVFTILHSLASVLFVCVLFIDEPHEWPPLFGDVRQAYSMRRFWAKYFDRVIYRTLLGWATSIVDVVEMALGLATGPWTMVRNVSVEEVQNVKRKMGRAPSHTGRKWLVNGLIFFLSGIAHASTSYWAGYRCGNWEELWYYMMNYATIVAETLVQEVIRRMFPQLYEKAVRGWIGKLVGFCWVFAFLFWAVPKVTFPTVSCRV